MKPYLIFAFVCLTLIISIVAGSPGFFFGSMLGLIFGEAPP